MKTLKFPKKIKVGAREIEIIYPYLFQDRTDSWALYQHQLQRIKIAREDGAGNRRGKIPILADFIHELLHAIDDTYLLHLFENDAGEDKVQVMAEAITQILIDNGYLKLEDFE